MKFFLFLSHFSTIQTCKDNHQNIHVISFYCISISYEVIFHLHHFYTNQIYPYVITNHELQRKAYTLARIPKKVLRNLGRLTLEYEM